MSKKIYLSLLIIFMFFLSPKLIFSKSKVTNTIDEARVLEIKKDKVSLKILTGDYKNKTINIEKNLIPLPYQLEYKTGEKVIITESTDPDGKTIFYISDVDRKPALLLLLTIFILLVILITKTQGITSILGMIFSFYIILQMIIPSIINGTDPLISVFIGALLIIPVSYYLAHGLNKKTHIAIAGTFLTLILTAFLAYYFSQLAKLTGFSSEEAVFLQNSLLTGQINIKSLFLAGLVVGALAVLNDITISQSSIVESLYASNNKLTFWQLYNHAMKVGRDHVASLVNTLILVYIGASFPLVILFYNSPISLGLVANQEVIATEIVRTLVTSIGIIAAVPITTYLSCLFIKN